MHRRRIDIFDEIGITGAAPLASDAASRLGAELGEWSAFDISQMADSDDDLVVSIEILRVKLLI